MNKIAKCLVALAAGTIIALTINSTTYANPSLQNPDGGRVPGATNSPEARLCAGTGGTLNGRGECINPNAGGRTLQGTFSTIVNILLFLIGAVAVVMIIVGGFRYVISNGDQKQVADAKNTILYAVIGLVIAIAGFAIVNFVVDAFV